MGAGHADDTVPEFLDDAAQIMGDQRLILDDEHVGGDLFGDFGIGGVDEFGGCAL